MTTFTSNWRQLWWQRKKKCLKHATNSIWNQRHNISRFTFLCSWACSKLVILFLLIIRLTSRIFLSFFLSCRVWATNIFNVNDESFPIYDWNQVWHTCEWESEYEWKKFSIFIVMLLVRSCVFVSWRTSKLTLHTEEYGRYFLSNS